MTKPQAKRLLSLLFIACGLLASLPVAAQKSTSNGLRFTILHTNDLHAHDDPFIDHGHTVGGMEKIAHLIRSIRATNPNVLAIDAGDIFQGTPYFKFYHGEVEVELLNRAGYDIYTIGNHEFDDGAANLATQLKRAKFAVINANMDASAQPALNALFKPSVIKTINGQRVGFIGAVVPDLTRVSLGTDGVKVKGVESDWKEPIKQEIARLKADGIDKIILVTHCGVELDKQLAQIPDVDAIVGGHSHTRLTRPIIVDHPDGSKCVIVQTGSYGRNLGKLDIAFDSAGKIDLKNVRYKLIPIDESIPSEKDIQDYLAEKVKPFISLRRTIVGAAASPFDNAFRNYKSDSAIGNLIADALAEGGAKHGATIAFQNRGGIRARIESGLINEEKIDEVLPFENHLIIATINGKTLRDVLENSVSNGLGAKFLDVHGLRFEYDGSAPPLQRVRRVWTTDGKKFTPISEKAEYRIAINSYSFKGGESYEFSTAKDVVDTGNRLSMYLHDYVVKHKKIYPRYGGRIIPLAPKAPMTYGQPQKAATPAAK